MKIIKNHSLIPFFKPAINRFDLSQVLECMIKDQLEEGETTEMLEKKVAEYLNIDELVLVNSGSIALLLALSSLDLQVNDGILCPIFISPTYIDVIKWLNLNIRFINSQKDSIFPSTDNFIEAITDNTKVIIISHSLACYFPVKDLMKKLNEYNQKNHKEIILIENSTQRFIPHNNDSLNADFTFYSFESDQIITTGHGAGITAKNKRHLKWIKDRKKYRNQKQLLGRIDCSITDIQSAIGLSELNLISKFIKRRQEIADYYCDSIVRNKKISILPDSTQELNSQIKSNSNPLIYYFAFKVDGLSKDKIINLFKRYNIEIQAIFPQMPHRLLNLDDLNYINAVSLYSQYCLLPIYPTLTKQEIEHIGSILSLI